MNHVLWGVFPYVALTVMVVASIYRYKTDPAGWTSRSSELLEKWRLRWGSMLFHWGIVFVFLGHVAGLLVPVRLYRMLDVSDELYHVVAIVVGGIAGTAVLAGLLILLHRRLTVKRVLHSTTVWDWIALLLLLVTAGLGMGMTLGWNLGVGSYEYRETVGPWIRSILAFRPDPDLMAGAPWVLKLHILSAFALFAISPFTRLVHIWSLPLSYLGRAPILYRRRPAAAVPSAPARTDPHENPARRGDRLARNPI